MDIQQPLLSQSVQNTTVIPADWRYALTGSFRSLSLFLLAFSPSRRTLTHVQTVEGFGPHQYLAVAEGGYAVYATSWTVPPQLYSWEIRRNGQEPRLSFVNSAPITAVSSYISIPPPFTHIYSMGGPTGEVHAVDAESGGFGPKIQEVLFVPPQELANADKTRVALRYGSHGIEFTNTYAFVPVLGTNTIEMYRRNRDTGELAHIRSILSPRGPQAKDSPRHVKIHPNQKILYCVTEHSNLLDVYSISPDPEQPTLVHLSSHSLLPDGVSSHQGTSHFRGDTLQVSPSSSVLITTTRGSSSSLKGWLSIFALDESGNVKDGAESVERWETPTSGGKANAIELLAKQPEDRMYGAKEDLWILLTDDDEVLATEESGVGSVRVLEWNSWGTGGVKIVAQWPEEETAAPDAREQFGQGEKILGASHAIWLD